MASAAVSPIFSFHPTSTSVSQPSPSKPKSQVNCSPIAPKSQKTLSLYTSRRRPISSPKSIDVSQEDKPISAEDQNLDEKLNPELPTSAEDQNIDKRRLEEKFAVLNTGIYECRSCGYRYDEAAGDPLYPIPPGLPFNKLPDDWRCPTCGAAQSFFESKSVEIAGFAQNQQYGLGGNALTSGQKALLIYGSLAFFFLLFISGYFLP